LICVKGSKKLTEALAAFEITSKPQSAVCTVIEIPGYYDELNRLTDNSSVIVVITGMVNLKEWKIIQKFKHANLESLPGKIESYLQTFEQQEEPDISFEFEEDTFEENTPVTHQHDTVTSINKVQDKPQHTSIFNQSFNKRGYIAASFSASGGVGKTFSSINMGGCAALVGISTVAVDLDFGFGDMDTAMGLVDPRQRDKVLDKKAVVPKNGWATVAEWRRFARDLKGSLLRHNSGLYVLPCYPYAGNEIPGTEIEDLILTLAEQFDLVVIDLGVDAFSPHARTALNLADTVFLIGGQDEKTIGKLTQFLGTENAHTKKMKLVINMVVPTGYYTPKEVAKKLGFDSYDEIPLDTQGVNAAKKNRKLAIQLNGSTAGNAVKVIASKRLPFQQLAYEEQLVGGGKKSLFSGLKSMFRRG